MHFAHCRSTQLELSDAKFSNEALQQQLQAVREEASALQQQLVDARQQSQEQVKELRAANAALHVSDGSTRYCCFRCRKLAHACHVKAAHHALTERLH